MADFLLSSSLIIQLHSTEISRPITNDWLCSGREFAAGVEIEKAARDFSTTAEQILSRVQTEAIPLMM